MFYVFLLPIGALKFKFCHKTSIHLSDYRDVHTAESLLISAEIILWCIYLSLTPSTEGLAEFAFPCTEGGSTLLGL
jgi:hypothetical protein